MSVFSQDRACVTLRILTDASADWSQATLEITGVERSHLLALNVHHPERLSELPSQLPRLLLEVLDELRRVLDVDVFRELDEQTF